MKRVIQVLVFVMLIGGVAWGGGRPISGNASWGDSYSIYFDNSFLKDFNIVSIDTEYAPKTTEIVIWVEVAGDTSPIAELGMETSPKLQRFVLDLVKITGKTTNGKPLNNLIATVDCRIVPAYGGGFRYFIRLGCCSFSKIKSLRLWCSLEDIDYYLLGKKVTHVIGDYYGKQAKK